MKIRAPLAFAALILAPSAAHADDITISPRLWLVVDALTSGNQVASNGSGVVASFNSEQFVVPMFGGSLAYRSDSFLKNTTFTATALFGKDTKTLTTRGASIIHYPPGSLTIPTASGDQLVFTTQTTPERLHRRDLELTAQTRINDLLSWTLGVRWEHARVRFSPTFVIQESDPNTAGVIVTDPGFDPPFSGGYDLYSARAGIAASIPLNEKRTDLLYMNGMAFIGHRSRYKNLAATPQYADTTFIGPDITIGYTHRFTNNLSFDLRYRSLFFFPISGPGKFGDPKNTHGPSVAVAYTF